jgi:VIT1/CCC1 family predicted Fe2+/Mn2+ transporter
MYLKKISFGGTAAIITNMALVTGLQTASASRGSIVASLLIIAVADNLTDSLSVHLYQESENMEPHSAFIITVSNYFTRLGVSLSFIAQIFFLPLSVAIVSCLVWGLFLLCSLTVMIARQRQMSVWKEIIKHLLGAAAVILLARGIGYWILVEITN